MRILFYGIYQFGAGALDALLRAGFDVPLVITKADDPNGAPQPVRQVAERHGLPWLTPGTMADPHLEAAVRQADCEVALVAGFHRKIPTSLLHLPAKGTLNIHGSPLPRFRGPTPWKHAILLGERESGVTAHVMTEEMDKGPILHQVRFPILEDDTGGSLFDRTCGVAAEVAVAVCRDLAAGRESYREQDESLASSHPNLSDAECRIDWTRPAGHIRNLVRALNPRPGAWTLLQGQRQRVWVAEPSSEPALAAPGVVQAKVALGWLVATGDGCLLVKDLRLEGEGPNLAAAQPPGGAWFE